MHFSDYHDVHHNTASGRLRTGGQSYNSLNINHSYTDSRVGGSFTSMVCDREGTGDCNTNSHWIGSPNLDGSLIMTMTLSSWSIRQHAGVGASYSDREICSLTDGLSFTGRRFTMRFFLWRTIWIHIRSRHFLQFS